MDHPEMVRRTKELSARQDAANDALIAWALLLPKTKREELAILMTEYIEATKEIITFTKEIAFPDGPPTN